MLSATRRTRHSRNVPLLYYPLPRRSELKEAICPACIGSIRAGRGWGYQLPIKEDLREGFGELFKAARVLLKENAEENQIIPTLTLANHLCHGVPRLVTEKERLVRLWGDEQAWDKEADRFARRFGGSRPVRVTHGVGRVVRRRAAV